MLAVGVAALATAAGWSCGGSADPGTAPVAAVALSDTALVLRQGDEAALVARPSQAGGEELVGRRIFWSSRDPGVVEVSQAGVIRALAVGTTEVAANIEGRSALASVTVLARSIATVQIDPATLQLAVNGRQRLAARTLNDAGGPAAAAVTWTSLSPEVVSVSADGEVTGVAPGVGSVRATAEGATATAAVLVTPVPVANIAVTPAAPSVVAGSTLQLTAVIRDAAGGSLANRTVSWNSRDPGTVVVSSTGQVTGIAPGSGVVVATADGQSATVTVTVTAVPVARVTVTPDGGTVGVGGTLPFAAALADAAGRPLAGRAVAFSSSVPGVARVNDAGVVTGVSAGTATIRATSEGVTGSATVRVVASSGVTAVASVSVAPTTAALGVGETRAFTATARSADGSVVGNRPVGWRSSNSAVVTVLPTGAATAAGPGTAQVIAEVDGITGTAAVTVAAQRAAVASVQVAPATAAFDAGSAVQLVATPRDAAGNSLGGRIVTCSSADNGIATVISDGRDFGAMPDTTTVRATSEQAVGTASVTVRPVIRLSADALALRERGNTRSAQLLAYDHRNVLLPSSEVRWTSSNDGVATVTNGLVRAVSSGGGTATALISATYRGVTATVTVTVTRN